MAAMKRCKNRVPEAMAGNVPPHQRPQCDREYDPRDRTHGGKCKATRRHKNPEGKHVGHTEWQWYADRAEVDKPKIVINSGPVIVHSGPPPVVSDARDVMARARLANGGRGATEPVGSTKFQRAAAGCTCPDEAAGTLFHVSPCRKAGLMR